MGVPGAKPKEDRSQVVNRARVHEFDEIPNVPFQGGPELPPRAGNDDPATWTTAGVIPGSDWPQATKWWWDVVRTMPHCVRWTPGDWAFAAITAECHARFTEGWRGYTGAELRQREKLMGVYLDARRDLRIKYVDPPPERTELPANVSRLDDFRDL
jgi:hypothetical protein